MARRRSVVKQEEAQKEKEAAEEKLRLEKESSKLQAAVWGLMTACLICMVATVAVLFSRDVQSSKEEKLAKTDSAEKSSSKKEGDGGDGEWKDIQEIGDTETDDKESWSDWEEIGEYQIAADGDDILDGDGTIKKDTSDMVRLTKTDGSRNTGDTIKVTDDSYVEVWESALADMDAYVGRKIEFTGYVDELAGMPFVCRDIKGTDRKAAFQVINNSDEQMQDTSWVNVKGTIGVIDSEEGSYIVVVSDDWKYTDEGQKEVEDSTE